MKITGAQATIKSLEQEGVEVMFGIPGGAILPLYDPLIDSPVRHILCRHEQGAAHAADGFAQGRLVAAASSVHPWSAGQVREAGLERLERRRLRLTLVDTPGRGWQTLGAMKTRTPAYTSLVVIV